MSQHTEVKGGDNSIVSTLVRKTKDILQLDGIYTEIVEVLSDLQDEYFTDEASNSQIVWNSGAVDGCVVLTWASADKTWRSAYNKRISITFNALRSHISIRLGGDFSDDLGFNSIIDIASSGNRKADLEELRRVTRNILQAQNEDDTAEEYDCDLWYELQTGLKIRGAQ